MSKWGGGKYLNSSQEGCHYGGAACNVSFPDEAPVLVSAAPLPVQLTAKGPGKAAEDGLPATQVEILAPIPHPSVGFDLGLHSE